MVNRKHMQRNYDRRLCKNECITSLMHLMIQLIDNHDNIDEATVQRHIRWTKGTRLC